ncbi:MAG: hypothetical protein JNK65_03555 [Deltaproteobacteria bacterium]|nr:hypothetical protein [Deltaproteobacteria bacterium]
MRLFQKIFFLFILLFMFACATQTPPRISSLPDSQKTKILNSVKKKLEMFQKIESAKGFAQVKLKLRNKKQSLDEVVFLKFPKHFRFETLDDFGNLQFFILSDGENLRWEDRLKGQSSEIDLSEKNLRRFLPSTGSIDQTLALFIGKIPLLDLEEAKVFPKNETYEVEFQGAVLVWNPIQEQILSLVFKNNRGKTFFRFEGSDFKNYPLNTSSKDFVSLPSRVLLQDFKTKNELEIRYQSLELNSSLNESMFE